MSQWYSIYSFLHPQNNTSLYPFKPKPKKHQKTKQNEFQKKNTIWLINKIFHPYKKDPFFKKKSPPPNGSQIEPPLRRFQALTANWPWGRGSGARLEPNRQVGMGDPGAQRGRDPLLGNPKKKQALYIYIYYFWMGISGTSIFSKIPRKQNKYHGYTVRVHPIIPWKFGRNKIKRHQKTH